jgi:uncharacterized protein YndB with AHSA1/START domain
VSTADDASAPSRVLVALRVDATPERAFAAFTREIAQWWRPNRLFQFSPGRSGVLSFEAGAAGRLVETYDDGTTFVIGEVHTWDPPHHLALSWRQASFGPDQSTELHVRFERVGAQTRVSVEHLGWDTIPQQHAARHGFPLAPFQLRLAEWWQAQLRNLAEVASSDRSSPLTTAVRGWPPERH